MRRKIAELAEHKKGAELQAGLGRHHVLARPDAVAFLDLDGHVRVYSGTRQLPKTHIARMRIAGPATEETWIGDAEGDPVMVITAAPSQSLASELHRLLPELRSLVGPNRWCTVVFDRGGYSPAGVHRDHHRRVRPADLLQGQLGPRRRQRVHDRGLHRCGRQ